MLILCGGALLAGMVASLAIPFVPFAAALLVAIGIGAVWAGLHGTGLAQALLSAFGVLVSTQVGYGLGLVGAAAGDGLRQAVRRPSDPKAVPPGLSDLPIGKEH